MLDDLQVELKDGRRLVLTLRGDDRTVTREIPLPGLPIYQGVFKSERTYSKGDMVTYGGSMWEALEDTSKSPPGNGWRLVVKGGK